MPAAPNYEWKFYGRDASILHATDGTVRAFTPAFPGFNASDFKAYFTPAGGDRERGYH